MSARATTLRGSLLFHLNLSYSSIDEDRHAAVIERCYRPLLGLVAEVDGLRLALELSGSTLERIADLAPDWVDALRGLLDDGRVELVGSGDTQLIGPLVPASVNAWNQRLGVDTYERLLDRRPSVALVNEMAWSAGLVDSYLDAGYRALLMEWNNPRREHDEWDEEWRFGAVRTASPGGREIELLWVDAVAFQKLQRCVHGEVEEEDYLAWLGGLPSERERHVFLYASDAEVFDYRPGRFAAEAPHGGASEWERMATLLRGCAARGVEFTTPTAALDTPALAYDVRVELASAQDPIPVKKQPKYNVTRWALSGRDDVGLNARCFARAKQLERDGGDAEQWRALCRSWASDLRTHLSDARWEALAAELEPLTPLAPVGADAEAEPLTITRAESYGRRVELETDGVQLALDSRRGLALEGLRFKAVGDERVLGTLPHGFFDPIDWAADFYSGHTVVEMPARGRVTDLEPAVVELEDAIREDRIEVGTTIDTPLGPLAKTILVFADRVELRFGFSAWTERPSGTLRTAILTLDPLTFGPELRLTCAHGGVPETFEARAQVEHGRSVSLLVSAGAALGSTDGRLTLDDGHIELDLRWPHECAAALPLVTLRDVQGKRFGRISFSLSELDETHRPGAPLPDFALTIRARRLDR